MRVHSIRMRKQTTARPENNPIMTASNRKSVSSRNVRRCRPLPYQVRSLGSNPPTGCTAASAATEPAWERLNSLRRLGAVAGYERESGVRTSRRPATRRRRGFHLKNEVHHRAQVFRVACKAIFRCNRNLLLSLSVELLEGCRAGASFNDSFRELAHDCSLLSAS